MGDELEQPVFFADENVGRPIARALAELGYAFEHLLDHFGQGTEDVDFLPAIAERGWFLITQDQKIRTKPHERQALMNAGVGAFIFTGRAQKSREEFTIELLTRLPEIMSLTRTKRPFIFGIPNRGDIHRLDGAHPADQKRKRKRKGRGKRR